MNKKGIRNYNLFRVVVLVIFTILLLVSCNAAEETTSTGSSPSGDFPQKFNVEGNLIVDASGKEIIFRGLNAIDPLMQVAYESPQLYGAHEENYYKKMSEWGATIVRIPIHPIVWRDYPEQSLEVIDQTVEWIGNQKMYAILDFHSIGFVPSETYEADFYAATKSEIKSFWSTMSQRYKDNNIIAFYEIFNEPVNVSSTSAFDDWNQWKTVAEEIIDVIRANDPDSLIIVGGMSWSYDLSYILDNPVNKSNIVYAVHPYPSTTDTMPWDDAFGKVKDTYPIIATEIGFSDQDAINTLVEEYSQLPAEIADEDMSLDNPELYIYMETLYGAEGTYREDVISYLNQKRIGWVAWNFSPFWIPTLLKSWDYETTNSGAFFKEQLQSQ